MCIVFSNVLEGVDKPVFVLDVGGGVLASRMVGWLLGNLPHVVARHPGDKLKVKTVEK